MAISAREPTNIVPVPNVLVQGIEGAGKSYQCARLTGDERIGPAYFLDWGEGSADQYGQLGDYLVLEHDGTYASIRAQVDQLVQIETPAGGPVPCVIFDSVSTLWDDCKDWAEQQARSRGARQRQSGEVVVSMDLWNAAKRRFYAVIEPLLDWDGLVLLLARARWVAEVGEQGQPTGSQAWTAEQHKGLPFAVDVVLRLDRPRHLAVAKARTLRLTIPEDGLALPVDTSLEQLIFDRLGVTAGALRDRRARTGRITVPTLRAEVLARLAELGVEGAEAKTLARSCWDAHGLPEQGEVDDRQAAALLGALADRLAPGDGGELA